MPDISPLLIRRCIGPPDRRAIRAPSAGGLPSRASAYITWTPATCSAPVLRCAAGGRARGRIDRPRARRRAFAGGRALRRLGPAAVTGAVARPRSIECARRAPGHRRHPHLRPPRGHVRLRRGSRGPPGLHGSLPRRLPACACEHGGRGGGRALPVEGTDGQRVRRVAGQGIGPAAADRGGDQVGRRGRNRSVAPSTSSRSEAPDLTRVELSHLQRAGHAGWTGSRRSGRPGGCAGARRGPRASAGDLRGARGEPFKRATIAGYEAAKAARFGAHTGMDPARAPRQGS